MPSMTDVHPTTERLHALDALRGMPAATSSATQSPASIAMPGPLTILQHSPWWIYPLLLLLVWFGVRGMRPRTLPIWRLAIVPLVFTGWGIVSILSRPTNSGVLIADWLVCAAVGAGIAWLSNRRMAVAIDFLRGKVTLQGSIGPLVRNLLVFAIKYAVGVAIALLPTRRAEIAALDIGISGAMAGYFLGWLGRLTGTLAIWKLKGLSRYLPAPHGAATNADTLRRSRGQ